MHKEGEVSIGLWLIVVASGGLLTLGVMVWLGKPKTPKTPASTVLVRTLAERDEDDGEALSKWFGAGNITCPDCGGKLLAGPCGGAAQNALCEGCYAEFNVCGPLTHRLAPLGQGRKYLYGLESQGGQG